MKTFFFLLVLNLFGISHLHAASDTLYPEVGKPCPEFLLKNVAYYKKKEVKLSDFKGKWLILDFWNKYCSSCIKSFPETNAMQKEFKERVEFILIGIQDPENQIRNMYEKFQQRMNLQLPCAFDSSLSNYWGIISTPHIIIIDDKGTVQAVTNIIDNSAIHQFLNGQHPVLPFTYYAQRKDGPDINEYRIPFEANKPYMINDNGAKSNDSFLFRSVLSKYDQTKQHYYTPVTIDVHSIVPSYPKGMFQVLAVDLKQLYLYAYFGADSWRTRDTLMYGKYSNVPLLEFKDSSLFQYFSMGNRFCYSLILPPEKGSKENLQLAMQRDLKTYFGYEVSIEKRNIHCWRLLATKKASDMMQARDTMQLGEAIPGVVEKLHNIPMSELVQRIVNFIGAVVIDETRIIGNVNFTLNHMDLDDIKKSLRSSGLDLVQSVKEMKVLVIRDPNRMGDNCQNY
jgi:thiol-disulfide isomerase/thioredoxin